MIQCRCGCGQKLNEFDGRGRKRKYINGHNKNRLGKIPWNKNKFGYTIHTEEFRKRMSIRLALLKGEDNYNYKNPKDRISLLNKQIRKLPKYLEWRIQIFNRDNFTCQYCSVKGVCLEAHHIISMAELVNKYNINTKEKALSCNALWDLNNGITLCKECHSKTKNYKGNGGI